jgi:hypothetical protein
MKTYFYFYVYTKHLHLGSVICHFNCKKKQQQQQNKNKKQKKGGDRNDKTNEHSLQILHYEY